MSSNGAGDLLVQARSALLDALTALWEHRDSVVVIGAQAIYLHTGAVSLADIRSEILTADREIKCPRSASTPSTPI